MKTKKEMSMKLYNTQSGRLHAWWSKPSLHHHQISLVWWLALEQRFTWDEAIIFYSTIQVIKSVLYTHILLINLSWTSFCLHFLLPSPFYPSLLPPHVPLPLFIPICPPSFFPIPLPCRPPQVFHFSSSGCPLSAPEEAKKTVWCWILIGIDGVIA